MLADGHTHTLIIPEVFPEDQGEYVCEAYNDFGDTDTFCRLVVKGLQLLTSYFIASLTGYLSYFFVYNTDFFPYIAI